MKSSDDQIPAAAEVTGIIMPHNWDENGKLIQIAIYTNTEEIFEVSQSSLSQEFMRLIHKRVEVRGRIRERPDGNKSMVVQEYVVREEIVEDEMKP
jgi:hypothetical protein